MQYPALTQCPLAVDREKGRFLRFCGVFGQNRHHGLTSALIASNPLAFATLGACFTSLETQKRGDLSV